MHLGLTQHTIHILSTDSGHTNTTDPPTHGDKMKSSKAESFCPEWKRKSILIKIFNPIKMRM